ncbi:hypothetical protein SODALDRAFT_125970 [Sodiomyces alkalinus F11]|uniref:CCHC-type domain-containing protein n=1 Tax=Sodiomyces alkalinus (strain CBS 110278 / VKM F-3762 / F11) TaxID=1314773 RepID=A0A3N2Q4T8_SODAK|nr:hypothetical protein SODALDRAFT_125970 [Sodiomyces alkalinus F11]ROT41678.1 hypothetical protein SODALDRAFT_125970 [Sodiomyces alkalinus F11]
MGDLYRNRSPDRYRPRVSSNAQSRSRSPPRAFFQNVGTQWSMRVTKTVGGVVRNAEFVNRSGGGNYNIKGTLPGGGLVVQTKSSAGTRAFAEEACRDMPRDGVVLIAIPVSSGGIKCPGNWDSSGLFPSPGRSVAPSEPSVQPAAASTHPRSSHSAPLAPSRTPKAPGHDTPSQGTPPRVDLLPGCGNRTSLFKTEDLLMKIEQLRRDASGRGHSSLPQGLLAQTTQIATQGGGSLDTQAKQGQQERTASGAQASNVTASVICRENNRHKTCANCGRVGHAVIDCLKPGKSGFIEACAICNEHHLLDSCSVFQNYSVYRKLALCILQRGRRPPLATAFNWVVAYYGVVKVRTGAMVPPKGCVWPSDFPITAQEARSWLCRPAERQPWNYFDYTANRTGDLSPGVSTWSSAAVLSNWHRLSQTEHYADSFSRTGSDLS